MGRLSSLMMTTIVSASHNAVQGSSRRQLDVRRQPAGGGIDARDGLIGKPGLQSCAGVGRDQAEQQAHDCRADQDRKRPTQRAQPEPPRRDLRAQSPAPAAAIRRARRTGRTSRGTGESVFVEQVGKIRAPAIESSCRTADRAQSPRRPKQRQFDSIQIASLTFLSGARSLCLVGLRFFTASRLEMTGLLGSLPTAKRERSDDQEQIDRKVHVLRNPARRGRWHKAADQATAEASSTFSPRR